MSSRPGFEFLNLSLLTRLIKVARDINTDLEVD